MKMIKFFSVALIGGAIAMTSCSEAPKTETTAAPVSPWAGTVNVNVDNAASLVTWKGEMIGGLYGHQGTVALKESKLQLTEGKVSGGSFLQSNQLMQIIIQRKVNHQRIWLLTLPLLTFLTQQHTR